MPSTRHHTLLHHTVYSLSHAPPHTWTHPTLIFVCVVIHCPLLRPFGRFELFFSLPLKQVLVVCGSEAAAAQGPLKHTCIWTLSFWFDQFCPLLSQQNWTAIFEPKTTFRKARSCSPRVKKNIYLFNRRMGLVKANTNRRVCWYSWMS